MAVWKPANPPVASERIDVFSRVVSVCATVLALIVVGTLGYSVFRPDVRNASGSRSPTTSELLVVTATRERRTLPPSDTEAPPGAPGNGGEVGGTPPPPVLTPANTSTEQPSPLAPFSCFDGFKFAKDPESEPRHVRVMCFGDSLTWGNASHMPRKFKREPGGNYPMTLKELLRAFTCSNVLVDVFNLGLTGRTAGPGPNHYLATPFWKTGLTFAPSADAAVIILGTNDARVVYWRNNESFRSGLAEYVTLLRERAPTIRVILCSPPPVLPIIPGTAVGVPNNLSAYGVRTVFLREVIRPLVEAVAQSTRAEYLDMYAEVTLRIPQLVEVGRKMENGTATAEDMQFAARYVYDGLHPTMLLHDMMADIVYRRILSAL